MPEFWVEAWGRLPEQHAGLHHHMRAFLGLVRDRAAVGILLAALDKLIDGLAAHFQDEEDLMQRAGYPSAHAHRLLHEACLEQVRAERAHLALGQPRGLRHYQDLVRVWIIDHMRVQDRRFDEFMGAPAPASPDGPLELHA